MKVRLAKIKILDKKMERSKSDCRFGFLKTTMLIKEMGRTNFWLLCFTFHLFVFF
jgi:hypothetical protein